jgi:hypothetical protein
MAVSPDGNILLAQFLHNLKGQVLTLRVVTNDLRFRLEMTSMISVEKTEFNKKTVNFALLGSNTA